MWDKKSKKKKQLKPYIIYSSISIQMAVIIIAGVFFGDYLDNKNQLNIPIYTIIFSLLSVFLALYYVLKKITNYDKKI